MSNNTWQFFHRQTGRGTSGRKSLADFLAMAEAHRHTHFAEGLAELDRRANGEGADPALDRQTVLAGLIQSKAHELRTHSGSVETAYVELRLYAQKAWCCCFMDTELSDDVADLVEEEGGWRARADFIVILAHARDALGPAFFLRPSDPTLTPSMAARDRMLHRWDREAIEADFNGPLYATPQARTQWLSRLERDDLHEIVSNFDWDDGDPAILKEVIDHPACDKATAMSAFAMLAPKYLVSASCERQCPLGSSGWKNAAKRAHCRLRDDDFASAVIAPNVDVSLWQGHWARLSNDAFDLPHRSFEGFGSATPNPKYTYQGDMNRFLQRFERWSSLRLV